MSSNDASPILCATDFSVQAAEASQVAAALALQWHRPLCLAHAVDDSGLGSAYPELLEMLLRRADERLSAEAEALRRSGCDVVAEVITGSPARGVTELAEGRNSRLIVVSSLGQIAPSRLLVGSVAERVAETAPVPTLVVKRPNDLLSWMRKERRLRIMVAVDFSQSSRAALGFAKSLSQLASSDLFVAHVDWPPQEAQRLGLSGSMSLTENPPLVRQVLERDLQERVTDVMGQTPVTLRLTPGWGRTDVHLLELAKADQIDLLVVGTHQRHGLTRLRLGSVSRGILHHAAMNVAIVPGRLGDCGSLQKIHKVDRVLVPTDLSPLGNRAIPFAYGLLHRGGTVQIVHVVEPGRSGRRPEKSGQPSAEAFSHPEWKALANTLRGLVPIEAAERGILSEIELVESSEAALAIHQAAERFGADAICLSSHGQGGLSQALFGSVSQAVLKQAQRPVLIVPPEER